MIDRHFELPTAEGVMDTYAVRPAGNGPWPAVLFYMDGLGPRPVLYGMAQRLAALGYQVLLPNLYYRAGRAGELNLADDNARRVELFAQLDPARVNADTAALLAHLDSDATVRTGAVGCVGYCIGGRFAFAAAGQFPGRVAVAASIHGAGLATDAPDSPHRLAPYISAELYFAMAERDPWLVAGEAARLRSALDVAGCRYTIEPYPGTGHGFAVAGLPDHDQSAAERHWQRLQALFRRALAAA